MDDKCAVFFSLSVCILLRTCLFVHVRVQMHEDAKAVNSSRLRIVFDLPALPLPVSSFGSTVSRSTTHLNLRLSISRYKNSHSLLRENCPFEKATHKFYYICNSLQTVLLGSIHGDVLIDEPGDFL